MKDQYIVAVDLGTNGPKVGLFSEHGRLVGYEFEPVRLILLPDGGAEQDPDEWWRAIVAATRRLIEKDRVSVEEIAAICCTAQWSGTVAVDRSGRPLMNALIWMDARGAPHVGMITRGLVEVEGYAVHKLLTWLRMTGGVPGHAGKDPIAHILYLKHERPDIYRQTFKFLEPKDYLNLRLTGKYAASYDSITLHWITDSRDLSQVGYSERLLRMATVEREKFPELLRAVDILGPLQPQPAGELGLPSGIPVVVGTPDIPSAALGSGAVLDYQAHLYIGTSSWIGCHVPFKKTDVANHLASLPSAMPGRYLLSNEQHTSGACLTFLRDNVFYHQDRLASGEPPPTAYKLFDQIVQDVPAGSGNLIFTPWLYGERTPVDDHRLRGGFFNVSLETTRAHMIRAVFEGVAYNTRWLHGFVEKFVRRPIHELNIIGGGAKSDVWCQLFADVLDRKIRQVRDPILANARGAAFLASVALGHIEFRDIPGLVEITNEYRPNPQNRQVYDQLFSEFLNIYRRTSPICARLNKRGS